MAQTELAIFVGRPERGNFIGAIGTGANGHDKSRGFDLSKIAGLPDKGTFIIRAATFKTVDGKGLAAITEEDIVYSGLIVYDKSSSDRVEHDIFAGIDTNQETFIHLTNLTNYVLELRLDSSDGPKVAVLSPRQSLKKVWIAPKTSGFAYMLFPTYQYLDPNTGELNVFSDDEYVNGKEFEPEPLGSDQREIKFSGPASGRPHYNVAFIRVQNDTDSLLQFQTAEGNYKRNDRGTLNTSPGRTDVYQIDAGSSLAGKVYTAAGFQISRRLYPIGQQTVLPGHIYELVATNMNGTYQASPLRDLGEKSVADNIRVNLFGELSN
jgi:frataxin-like iron-binding protein CyaY